MTDDDYGELIVVFCRIASALERIAETHEWTAVLEHRETLTNADVAAAYIAENRFPLLEWLKANAGKVRPEVTVTRIRTPEEIEREATLGGSEGSLEEWTEIGERERRFDEENGKEDRDTGSATKPPGD